MIGLLASLGEMLISNWFGYRKKKASTEVELKELDVAEKDNKDKWRSSVLQMGGWWFQLIFVFPLGFWFGSICLYSIFWHKNGPWPHAGAYNPSWDIAALPPELMVWAGAIIAYLFLVSPGSRK